MRRTVKRIIDGDTFEVCRRVGDARRIRLAGVCAPEKSEAGGRTALNRLRGIIGGKTVTIVPVGRSYGRIVADVRHGRKLVNKRVR